jgi:dUTP pyrophosphatase
MTGLMILRAMSPYIAEMYLGRHTSTGGNSGFDLIVPESIVCKARQVTYVDFKVQGMTTNGSGFFLLPRSSLSKTPLRLANSVGLIDPTYRGNLIAALENTSSEDVIIPANSRPVQLALPSLQPFDLEWTFMELPKTDRGAGGFGSTGGGATSIS